MIRRSCRVAFRIKVSNGREDSCAYKSLSVGERPLVAQSGRSSTDSKTLAGSEIGQSRKSRSFRSEAFGVRPIARGQ
jgi:hypothetical protein